MRNKISFWGSLVAAIMASSLVFTPLVVRAAGTFVEGGALSQNTVWIASSSPYILGGNIDIPSGRVLTVEPGVVIKGDPDLGYGPVIYAEGEININGTEESPVEISGISSIDVYYGTTTIAGAHISASGGLSFTYSRATISSSTISGSQNGTGLYTKASKLNISGSRIYGNDIGLFVKQVVPIFMVENNDSDGTDSVGGIGNAFNKMSAGARPIAQSVVPVIPSDVTITNSSLVGNTSAAIKNAEDTSTVKAANNWWGSADGPAAGQVIGQVDYVSWLDHDPTLVPTTSICCSSVLFIPGLEGSWLYKANNTLWAPNRNDDVRKLFLDENGSSTDKTIFSGEPISSVFNIYSVYGSFMKYMDKLVGDSQAGIGGKINEWKSFGYDWRKPIAEVVAGEEKKATTTESLLKVATDLASRSRTGKINIVAHSNGGLVAKYLMKSLADAGKADIVDGIVSVAVPYLGTPAAVSALLHGDHQAIAGGLILNSGVARQLGQNMPSAYSLLPSRGYFSRVVEPVISFASSTIGGLNPGAYSQFVKSFEDMAAFIGDKFRVRTIPTMTDTSRPIIGNNTLISAGDTIQSVLQNFSWPSSARLWSLVGWNEETPKGLVYTNKPKCMMVLWFKTNCSMGLARSENMTSMGDGTVVAPSAVSGEVISVDLASTSRSEDKNISHVDILESKTVQSIIRSILTGGQTASVASAISAFPGVSLGEPDYSKEPVRLVASADAQAELHVQDVNGKHTGIVTPPAGVDVGLTVAYEEQIPGSHFSLTDESDMAGESRISLPDDGQPYSVVVRGNSFGSFTLNVDRVQGATTLGHQEFTDIPMTPLSVATATIVVDQALATSTSAISLDIDGDGVTDFVAGSTTSVATSSDSDVARLELFEKFAGSVLGQGDRYISLAKRFEKIEDKMKKNPVGWLRSKKWSPEFIEKFARKFGHKKAKDLKAAERREFGDMIESMLEELER